MINSQVAAADAITSFLPLVIILVPLVGAFLLHNFCQKAKPRNICAAVTSLVTAIAVVSAYPLIRQHAVEYTFLQMANLRLFLRIDYFSFIFAALISLIWFLTTLHATDYMAFEHEQNRFFTFIMLTLGSCLGFVLSGDLITLFIFYVLLNILSYVVAIHEKTPAALCAGNGMLYLGIIGSFFLLAGMVLLYKAAGTLEIMPLYEKIAQSSINPYLVMALFVIGFGVKTGMIPLHIWLPKVDPAAPAPVSTLLCSLITKTGVYGTMLVLVKIFTPASIMPNLSVLLPHMNYGYAFIWFGIITMFLGAFMALLATQTKRLLAYSTISQIGYIIMGIGTAAYLGAEGAIGFAGALYHVINHAFFKATLFLVVGAIYIFTHELDITIVRGMLKKVPFMGVIFLIAFAGIGGIPGFNGYASKTILHHALVEAVAHSNSVLLAIAEKIFVLTSAMTLCYFTKLFRGLFLGDVPAKFEKRRYKYAWPVYAALGSLGVIIVAIGLFPHFLLHKLIIPTLQGFAFDHHAIEHLYAINVWSSHDLQGMLIIVVLAVVMFWAMDRSNFFSFKFPKWLSIDYLFYHPVRLFCRRLVNPLRPDNAYQKTQEYNQAH
ncbi:MAG: NADH dehydrogenase subunit [Firmicutes bacterium]|nr:NADH dehydrogenase subunit [Bacillota bacterium]